MGVIYQEAVKTTVECLWVHPVSNGQNVCVCVCVCMCGWRERERIGVGIGGGGGGRERRGYSLGGGSML